MVDYMPFEAENAHVRLKTANSMTITLKTTIFASSALAGMLNLAHYAITYDQSARSSFAPKWAEATSSQPSPTPAPTKAQAAPAAQPTPAANPPAANDPATAAAAKLTAAGLKPTYAASYLSVQAQTGTPWQLVAAVHHVETGQRGDTAIKSYAGATGPMQFMPATFAHYAKDGDGDGVKKITDVDDALLSGGNYLRAGGADKGNYNKALFNYNHSNAYVAHVLSIARRLGL